MSAIIGIDADILFATESDILACTQGGAATISVAVGGAGYADDETFDIGGTSDIVAQGYVISQTAGVVDLVGITANIAGSGIPTAAAVATSNASASGDNNLTVDVDSIHGLVLPIWDLTDNTWSLVVNSGDGDEFSWMQFPERNEFSISISVDIAEHKVFVASPADAWVDKARLFMDWSGSMSGYLDASTDAIFNNMKAGESLWVLFLNSKLNDQAIDDQWAEQYWLGKVILGSVDMSTPVEDYVTLDVDFAGSGALYRSEMPY